MDSPIGRRVVLQGGGVIAAGSLAGCGYLEDDPIFTSLTVKSHAEEQIAVSLAVFDPKSDEDNVLFGENFELEGRDGENVDRRQFDDAFESKQAIVEIKASVMGADNFMRQFTYFPQCPQDKAEEQGHSLVITLHTDIEYKKGCGSQN